MVKLVQKNLFYGSLMDMLDSNDPLVVLANTIKWSKFENEFAKYYFKDGRPAKPIRLMVGLLLLKQLENLSDENVVLQWKRNPYFQYFCGSSDSKQHCHAIVLILSILEIELVRKGLNLSLNIVLNFIVMKI